MLHEFRGRFGKLVAWPPVLRLIWVGLILHILEPVEFEDVEL